MEEVEKKGEKEIRVHIPKFQSIRVSVQASAFVSLVSDERRTLLVERDTTPAIADLEPDANRGLDDPDEREDGERERGPVDERGVALAREDRPERPRDGDARGQVALRGRERVRRRGRLEEEAACVEEGGGG